MEHCIEVILLIFFCYILFVLPWEMFWLQMKICSDINTASCSTWSQTTAVFYRARPLSAVVNGVWWLEPFVYSHHPLCWWCQTWSDRRRTGFVSQCDIIVSCVHARCKYHRLKYGTELEQVDMIPPKFEKELRGLFCLLYFLIFLCRQIISHRLSVMKLSWCLCIDETSLYSMNMLHSTVWICYHCNLIKASTV